MGLDSGREITRKEAQVLAVGSEYVLGAIEPENGEGIQGHMKSCSRSPKLVFVTSENILSSFCQLESANTILHLVAS